MTFIPVVHTDPDVREMVRRGVKKPWNKVGACRTMRRLRALLQERLVDAVVIDVRAGHAGDTFELATEYPAIPFFAMSAFRPDDGRLLVACTDAAMEVLVVGVDDSVAGDIIVRKSAASRVRQGLADAPRLLRLNEPMQLQVWDAVLQQVDHPLRTADLAESLGVSREHLSRDFAAGGAPNLKRVIDLARLVWAAHLLQNPGYTVAAVSRILGYASASHLAGCARRVAGVTPTQLPELGVGGVLHRFRRGRTRSRL